ncbi:MAG: hypothetical protein KJ737_24150 [Proteobacteria bacterium]|nr:hypothetical protein [Pseudomonadota bacterium]
MLNLLKDFDPSKIALKMIEMQKTAIDNSYESLIAIQSQTEKFTASMLDQVPYLPQDSIKVLDEWSAAYKKGQDEYKKSFDDNYKKLESFFTDIQKNATKSKGKTQATA